LLKEFQRLKEEEQKAIGWTAKRELAKVNYILLKNSYFCRVKRLCYE
jgi:hypothetical protein